MHVSQLSYGQFMHLFSRGLASVGTAVSLVLSTGCAYSGQSPVFVPLPPTTGAFDYQLGGGYSPARDVSVLTRDSTDAPAEGIYSICYVNGFQTQPGESWPKSLILKTAHGTPLVDSGWPDEHLIDISTTMKGAAAADRRLVTIAVCAEKGFKAAHSKGLAASQKNAPELAAVGKQGIGFDFATTEECDRFSECGAYTETYGKHVLDIEYIDSLRDDFHAVCARKATPTQTVLRDKELVSPDHQDYAYGHC